LGRKNVQKKGVRGSEPKIFPGKPETVKTNVIGNPAYDEKSTKKKHKKKSRSGSRTGPKRISGILLPTLGEGSVVGEIWKMDCPWPKKKF